MKSGQMKNEVNEAIILANGAFPTHSVPLNKLKNITPKICCDGAVNSLEKIGLVPDIIIGDIDSIEGELKEKYKNKIIKLDRQSDSDLEKSLKYCLDKNILDLVCIGISGLCEDHLMANLFLLWNYCNELNIKIYTDFGLITFVKNRAELISFQGQIVSLFSMDPKLKISTNNLKYKINNKPLKYLYKGCSNESISNSITIECGGGNLMIFQKYR